MIEFQLTNSQYVNMMRAIMRRRLLIAVPAVFGLLWIVGWILFAIAEGDAWSALGSFAVLLLVGAPIAALSSSIRMSIFQKRFAKKMFLNMSSDGERLDIQCQLEDGQLKYYNVSRNNLYEIDLKQVKRVNKFKDFFMLEMGKRIGYLIPFNSETESLYNQIREQRSALKNS